MRKNFFECWGVNMVNVTEEPQMRICCTIKKNPNSLYYSTLENFPGSLSGCKPQARLNSILRWGVCLASFLCPFLSFLIFFPFLSPLTCFFQMQNSEHALDGSPCSLLVVVSCSDQGNRASEYTGHQKKCLDALKNNFLTSPPRLMSFPLAVANSFCSHLPLPPNLCNFNQVSVKYCSKLLYAVRLIIAHM